MNRKAFTLIELLIAVIILAVIATLALPIYIRAMERSKVGEATSNLALIRTAQKTYFLDNGTYTSVIGDLYIDNPNSPTSRYFDYTIPSASSADFTARASRRSNAPSPYDGYYYEISEGGSITSNGPFY